MNISALSASSGTPDASYLAQLLQQLQAGSTAGQSSSAAALDPAATFLSGVGGAAGESGSGAAGIGFSGTTYGPPPGFSAQGFGSTNLLQTLEQALNSVVGQSATAANDSTSQTSTGQDLLQQLAQALQSVSGQAGTGHAGHGHHLLHAHAQALQSVSGADGSAGSSATPQGQVDLQQLLAQALQSTLGQSSTQTAVSTGAAQTSA